MNFQLLHPQVADMVANTRELVQLVALVVVVAHQVLEQVGQEILQVHLQLRELLVELQLVVQKQDQAVVVQLMLVLVDPVAVKPVDKVQQIQ
jgi:hypothetical protein